MYFKNEGEIKEVADKFCQRIAPFVRSVQAVAVSEDDLVFHIESFTPIQERRLRLALDLQCEGEPAIFKGTQSEWKVLTVSGKYVDIRLYGVTWSFDIAFVEAIIIGLEETVEEEKVFTVSDLGTVFLKNKQDAIAAYRCWIDSVLTHEQDYYTASCVYDLYPFLLCCPMHRLLRVQRTQFLEQIGHFDNHKKNAKDPVPEHYHPEHYPHPDNETLLTLVTYLLEQNYCDPKTLLYHQMVIGSLSDQWQYGLPGCEFWMHGMNQCCSFHLLRSCIYDIIGHWFDYVCWIYGIPFSIDDDAHHFSFGIGMSIRNVGQLFLRAGVDWRDIPFGEKSWFDSVPIYIELEKSKKALEKIHQFVKDGTNYLFTGQEIDFSEQEEAFLNTYAQTYGKSRNAYLAFLVQLYQLLLPYLDEYGCIRVKEEEDMKRFDEMIEMFPWYGKATRILQENAQTIARKQEYQGRRHFIISPMALLIEQEN